jgi:hypothetical protein
LRFNLVKHTLKIKNSKDLKHVPIFSLALVVVEFLVILSFFSKLKLQNKSEPCCHLAAETGS